MPPYLRDLPKPRCRCGRLATKELVNEKNASVGAFCSRCAKGALARLQMGETP